MTRRRFGTAWFDSRRVSTPARPSGGFDSTPDLLVFEQQPQSAASQAAISAAGPTTLGASRHLTVVHVYRSGTSRVGPSPRFDSAGGDSRHVRPDVAPPAVKHVGVSPTCRHTRGTIMSPNDDARLSDEMNHYINDDGTRMLSACRDCGFVSAKTVEDSVEEASTENDPAFRHYEATGHNTGSFEPASDLLVSQWEIAFGLGDYDELREDLYEVAMGISTDDAGDEAEA